MCGVALFASEADGTRGTVGSGSDGIGGMPFELFGTLEHWLRSLAEQLGAADGEAAQHLGFAFLAALIEAAGNVVFLLVMNSIRALYLDHLELFRPIVSGRAELVPRYRAAARAVADGDGDTAAAEVFQLATAQETRLLEALR
jgi:DNA-binding FadR family transcriptional regulator